MNPNETPVPATDPQPAPAPAPAPSPDTTTTPVAPVGPKKMTGRTKLALWLMIAPTGLFIAAFILNIIGSIVGVAVDEPSSSTMFNSPVAGQVALNVLGFIAGAVAFLTWLPGLITGIVLLTTKK